MIYHSLDFTGIQRRPSFHPAYPVYVGLTLSLLDVIDFDWKTHVLTAKFEMIYVRTIILFVHAHDTLRRKTLTLNI